MIKARIPFIREDLAHLYNTLDILAPGWTFEASDGKLKSPQEVEKIRTANLEFVAESILLGNGHLKNNLNCVLPSKKAAMLVKLAFTEIEIKGVD